MLCPPFKLINPFVEQGYEAVPFFFILSGFILSYNYFPEYSLTQHPKFIFLRFARIWPVHCATLLLLLLGPGLLQIKAASLTPLVEELLMIRLWFHSETIYNAPAWSISAEWFAYICVFPLAYLLFKRIRLVPCLVALVMLFLMAQVSPINSILFPSLNKCGTIFFLFLAGSGLYQIRRLVKNPPSEAIVFCGIFLFAAYIIFNSHLSELVLYVAFALLIFGLSYERGLPARILSTKWAVYGGLASYSLYMTHYLIIQTFISYSWPYWATLPKLPLIRFFLLLFMACVFMGTAILFYRYIEEPANKKLRRLSTKFKQTQGD